MKPIALGFDGDADGIPDAWELERAGNTTLLAATGDAADDDLPSTPPTLTRSIPPRHCASPASQAMAAR